MEQSFEYLNDIRIGEMTIKLSRRKKTVAAYLSELAVIPVVKKEHRGYIWKITY